MSTNSLSECVLHLIIVNDKPATNWATLTRLLGRLQPQMYPSVTLNQYTGVNRTHKHIIDMLHCQSVMKTSSHWRHKYNKEKQWIISFSYICAAILNINIFVYFVGGGGSIIRLDQSWLTSTLSLGIPGFPPGMPYGFVRIRHSRLPAGNALWFCQNFFFILFNFFFFFRRQGFRMIIFDRQAGPLQNFNRSHVMVIGRSVSFPTPRDPQVGRGAPQTPQNPPPPPPRKIIFVLHAFQNPRNIFENKNLVGKKNFCVLRPQEHFLVEIFFPGKNSTTNKLFTDRVLGISSIEFRQINPVL